MQCQNYRTLSLISHPSTIMLRVILNRLKTKAEELWLAHSRTDLQFTNPPGETLTPLVWSVPQVHRLQEVIWQSLVCMSVAGLQELQYRGRTGSSHTSAIWEILSSQLGEFFETTLAVHQGCLLSPILFNLFLEKIMQETLHEHHTFISIDGKPINNLWFADVIDFMGDGNGEFQDLTNRLVDSQEDMEWKSAQKTAKSWPTGQQHQRKYEHERPEVREGDQFQVPGSSPV